MFLALLLTTSALAGELHLEPAKVVDGEPVAVSVDGVDGDLSAAVLKVTYRSNSVLQKDVEIPLKDGKGTWTPEQSGVAALSVTVGEETISRNVAVGFGGIPLGGAIVFLLAGTLLFGGIGFAFVRLMGDAKEGIAGGVPLDT